MTSTSYYSGNEATSTYASQWSDDPMDIEYGKDISSSTLAYQRIAIEQDVVMWHATSFTDTRSPPPAYSVPVDEDKDREYGYEYCQPQFGIVLDPLLPPAPSPLPYNATREPEDMHIVHVLVPAQDVMRLKIANQNRAHARPHLSSPPTPSQPGAPRAPGRGPALQPPT